MNQRSIEPTVTDSTSVKDGNSEPASEATPDGTPADDAPDATVQEENASNENASDEAPSAEAPVAEDQSEALDGDAGGDAGVDLSDWSAEDVAELREERDALQQERDELNEKLLRKAAEFENYRKRMADEKQRRHASGKLEAVRPILEVLDDMERSLNAADDLDADSDPEAAFESLKSGVEMVHQKFLTALKNLDVEPIDAEGEPFDEAYHEAMMRQPSADAEPGTVLQEIRKGYVMDDRVIRHSRVVVATDPDE